MDLCFFFFFPLFSLICVKIYLDLQSDFSAHDPLQSAPGSTRVDRNGAPGGSKCLGTTMEGHEPNLTFPWDGSVGAAEGMYLAGDSTGPILQGQTLQIQPHVDRLGGRGGVRTSNFKGSSCPL